MIFSMNSLIIGVVSSEKSVYFFANSKNCPALAVSSSNAAICRSASATSSRSVRCSASYSANSPSKRSSEIRPTAKDSYSFLMMPSSSVIRLRSFVSFRLAVFTASACRIWDAARTFSINSS